MLIRKIVLCVALLLSFSIQVRAQYTFTILPEGKGGCRPSGQTTLVYSTLRECESERRASMTDWQWLIGNCYIRINATPCVYIGSGIEPSEVEVFYSSDNNNTAGKIGGITSNPANQIRDWAEDNAALMNLIKGAGNAGVSVVPRTSDEDFNKQLLSDINNSSGLFLDDDYLYGRKKFRPLNADTSSDDFKWRNVDMNNVNSYLSSVNRSLEPSIENPNAYMSWINQQFKDVTGIDMEALQRKNPDLMTNEEKQAILDYEVFAAKLIEDCLKNVLYDIDASEEKKLIDRAILCADIYGGENGEYLKNTDFVRLNTSNAPEEAKDLAKMIELCNDDTYGFHAELYYNEITKEYTIAFEGSSTGLVPTLSDLADVVKSITPYALGDGNYGEWFKDWYKTNAKQGLEGYPEQFKLVTSIVDMVNRMPDANISFTGHSLGGGLASFAGLLTGRETTTFNAEGVNWNIIGEGGLEAGQRAINGNNIKAYHTKDDILTHAQKALPIATAVGEEQVINIKSGHSVQPIVEHLLKQNGPQMSNWRAMSEVRKKYRSFLDNTKKIAMSAHNYTVY